MMKTPQVLLLIGLATYPFCSGAQADEPNESFLEATVLAPGVLSVDDDLSPGSFAYPDTVLGSRGMFGDIENTNDDDSPEGDGTASGLFGVSTNSGSIDFAVSGYDDFDFFGAHGEFGEYEVFVQAYDFFGDPVDFFSTTATLEPGNVDEYSYSDFEWIGGFYDVYIDNTIGGIGQADVDFFTFTGLTPGVMFTAETSQAVSTDLDTFLGWFDESGLLLETDDDGGAGFLSLLEGTVPANGTLTFAVTGFEDDFFEGSHIEEGFYTLQLELGGGTPGDFDDDGDIDGHDFLFWQRDTSIGDLADWQANYGLGLLANVTNVPEPASAVVLLAALGTLLSARCPLR